MMGDSREVSNVVWLYDRPNYLIDMLCDVLY